MAPSTLAQSAISCNPDVVIGVDTHKDIHVAVALAPNGGRLGECRIPTTSKGYDELIGWNEQFGYSPLFAMEGTGYFGAGLCRVLADAGFPVVKVNRPIDPRVADWARTTPSMRKPPPGPGSPVLRR